MLVRKGGVVARAIHVSSGAGGKTPAGNFAVYSKATMSWSKPFKTWLPFASYFIGGYALHEYPIVPGYPASHGCVRMPSTEAAARVRVRHAPHARLRRLAARAKPASRGSLSCGARPLSSAGRAPPW